jgi:hypothetical protein
MGVAIPHALGREQRFYAKPETTFATAVTPASGDAVKVLSTKVSFKQDRKDRMDTRQTRSLLERITGKQAVTWEAEMYVLPSGSAGTAPDCHDLFKAATGTETTNSGTSVVYTLASTQTALGSLTLERELSSTFSQKLAGAYVEQMTLKQQGGDPPMLTFSGGAATEVLTGYSTLNGSLSGGETNITIQSADVSLFANGSIIKVGTSTGHTVTAGGGTSSLTVSPAISGSQSNGAAVIPYVPTETTAGVPIAGIVGSFTIDSGSVPITAFEVTLKNGLKAVSNEAFDATGATDYIVGHRNVAGSISIRVRRDLVLYIAKRKLFTTRALVITSGSVAGKELVTSIPYAEFDFSDIEVPNADEATIQLPFTALGSSGEDEISFTWQ